jgi:regulator of sigma E protease
VKADAFSIGFGREIFGEPTSAGHAWKFGWLPLGGYVKLRRRYERGERARRCLAELPAEERATDLSRQAGVAARDHRRSGPAVNFLLAILILMGFAMAYGDSRTPSTIGTVVQGSAAATAGLQVGDRITALGGRHIETFGDIADYAKIRANEAVRIDFDRGGTSISRNAVIGTQELQDRFGNKYRLGLLGVGPARPVYVSVGLLEAPGVAIRRTGNIVSMMVETLGQIITGKRSVKELGGPLSIAKVSGEQLAIGPEALVSLIALVSINLGFINLLPVPMLDGGHLFFYAIEAVRRRPVKPEVQEWAFRGGLAALLALMMLVTFNDLGAFGLWKNLAGLIG